MTLRKRTSLPKISPNDYNKSLQNYGYIMKGSVPVVGLNSVLAINPFGGTVCVMMNDLTLGAIRKISTYMKTSQGFSEEIIRKAKSMVSDLTGALIVCKNGICAIVDTKEHYFVDENQQHDRVQIMPLLKYSELKHDAEATSSNSDIVCSRILKDFHDVATSYFGRQEPILEKMIVSAERLRDKAFHEETDESSKIELLNRIDQKNRVIEDLRHNSTIYAAELEKLQTMIVKLRGLLESMDASYDGIEK